MTPHALLLNKDGKQFVDITASSGTGELHKGHSISFADLDRSGNEAIIAHTGGAVPGDAHTLRVFKNPGNNNDWINVHLVGVKSNRSGVMVRSRGRSIEQSEKIVPSAPIRWNSTSAWDIMRTLSRSMCGGRQQTHVSILRMLPIISSLRSKNSQKRSASSNVIASTSAPLPQQRQNNSYEPLSFSYQHD